MTILRIWLSQIILIATAIQAFSPPPMGIGALFRPKNMSFEPNLGEDDELIRAAKFFTEAFW